MALDQDQLVTIRRAVGNAPDDAALDVIYARTEDVDELILEVLEIRLADLKRSPSSFAIPGEYSQSTAENIQALEREISLRGGGAGVAHIVDPAPSRLR